MDFFGAFISGILSVIVYIVVFMGVYKLYFIAKDLHEIKELMERNLRTPLAVAGPVSALTPVATAVASQSLSDEDTATAYAEQLLRAVSAESAGTTRATHEVR